MVAVPAEEQLAAVVLIIGALGFGFTTTTKLS